MQVEGPDYITTLQPVEDCKEQAIFNSYVYDVPMPVSGKVTITPGNQSAVTLDAGQVAKDRGATIYFARRGENSYQVTVIEPGKSDDVADAA
jgi:hypothetical protein